MNLWVFCNQFMEVYKWKIKIIEYSQIEVSRCLIKIQIKGFIQYFFGPELMFFTKTTERRHLAQRWTVYEFWHYVMKMHLTASHYMQLVWWSEFIRNELHVSPYNGFTALLEVYLTPGDMWLDLLPLTGSRQSHSQITRP